MKLQLLTVCFWGLGLLPALQTKAQQSRIVLPVPEGLSEAIKPGTTPATQKAAGLAPVFEIIDHTGDSLIVGYLPFAEENNDRIAVITPVTKTDWLLALAGEGSAKQLALRASKGIYVLNDLSVGKTAAGSYIRLKANLYESLPGSDMYRLVNRIDTFVVDPTADIKNVGAGIAGVINGSLFAGNGLVSRGAGNGLTREQLLKAENDQYAFISNKQFASGIYMNYDEFKSQKPSFGQFFLKADAVKNTVQVHSFTSADSTLRPVIPWGVAVGNELYIYNNNKLYPVEAKGNNLVLSKYIDPESRGNNARFWRMNVANRLEGSNKNPFDNINELWLPNYRNKGINGEATKINADTGTPEL
ncbi:hypothetical protein ACTJIJ_22680 [Niabella sp. 22666]|uniref:hypothetical protein n=1 Tax=Niabella sp. 22666 TaxID=3453954 RepID=UPI003F8291A1